MKTVCFPALLGLILASVGLADEPKAGAKAEGVVDKGAMAKAQGDEFFTALRLGFAARADFSPLWKMDDEREAVMKAVGDRDLAKVIALSKPWLEKVPVDAEVHLVRAQALKKTGDVAGAMHHFRCFYGLLDSITASGDGKSVKTGYKVISVAEEYYLLNEMGAEVLEQSLERPCDRMHVKLKDGTETDVYFDVSIPLKATSKLFMREKEKEKEQK